MIYHSRTEEDFEGYYHDITDVRIGNVPAATGVNHKTSGLLAPWPKLETRTRDGVVILENT